MNTARCIANLPSKVATEIEPLDYLMVRGGDALRVNTVQRDGDRVLVEVTHLVNGKRLNCEFTADEVVTVIPGC